MALTLRTGRNSSTDRRHNRRVNPDESATRCKSAVMGEERRPFIGSEAVASGWLSRYELRRYHRPIMPNIYLDKHIEPSLRQRVVAAHLWSGGEAVVAGLAASALHGSKWVDDDSPVELIWGNARSPRGVITRQDLLMENEIQQINGLRRDDADSAPHSTLDAVADSTMPSLASMRWCGQLTSRWKPSRNWRPDIADTRGLRQLEKALCLVDAGAESPRETWLRLMLIRDGYPRPETQIPVLSPDGLRRYYLDMGWRDLMLAVEYDGDHHRTSRELFAYEIERGRRHSRRRLAGRTGGRAQPPSRGFTSGAPRMGLTRVLTLRFSRFASRCTKPQAQSQRQIS